MMRALPVNLVALHMGEEMGKVHPLGHDCCCRPEGAGCGAELPCLPACLPQIPSYVAGFLSSHCTTHSSTAALYAQVFGTFYSLNRVMVSIAYKHHMPVATKALKCIVQSNQAA